MDLKNSADGRIEFSDDLKNSAGSRIEYFVDLKDSADDGQFKLSRPSSGIITLLSTERTGNRAIYAACLPPRHCEPAG
jgi:hypothetical protein